MFDIEREKELIRKVQTQNDKAAMKKLMAEYKGLMLDAIRKSGILSYVEEDVAERLAQNELKHSIKNKYTSNNSSKPSTFFYNNMLLRLRSYKYEHRPGAVRRGAKFDALAGDVAVADRFFNSEHGRNPTAEEAYSFIKNDMGKTPTDLSVEAIRRVRDTARRELSGDAIIGGEGGAEVLSVFDVMGIGDDKNFYKNQLARERMDRVLESGEFSRNERKFLKEHYGVSTFGQRGSLSMRQHALNSGLTYNEALSAMKKLARKLKED